VADTRARRGALDRGRTAASPRWPSLPQRSSGPIIAAGALVGFALLPDTSPAARSRPNATHGSALGDARASLRSPCCSCGLPVLRDAVANQAIALFGAFYRAGSLVFGGGHVVLPC
jgi:chromate transporter